MSTEDLDEILKGIEWGINYNHSYPIKGGQHCGAARVVRLSYLDLGITIECSVFRSQIENREACIDMLKHFLSKQTKPL